MYSHAFLCVALLGILLLSMLGGQLAAVPGAGVVVGLLITALLLWMPGGHQLALLPARRCPGRRRSRAERVRCADRDGSAS